ncbi:MAG: hypothetical protein FWE52_00345 [Alphaproteobacteria bacterium]|nr:hypothetical protein [Alphaproteobacteria bacterium]
MTQRRQLIISGQHRRLQRLWQFMFTGWGLVLVAALVAGAVLKNNLLWTPITAVNMSDVTRNQFKITNPTFAGTDKNGHPFSIHAREAHQEFDSPDKIFMAVVRATTVRFENSKKITDNIRADKGVYDRAQNTMLLSGNVSVDSSNGDKIRTREMVIRL